MSVSPKRRTGVDILVLAGAAALGISIFNYFRTDNGIHGSAGALLVIISSFLMVISAAALALAAEMNPALRGALVVLILLDILGTGLAAYMLEENWLVGAMAVALMGWVVRLVSNRTPGDARVRGAI